MITILVGSQEFDGDRTVTRAAKKPARGNQPGQNSAGSKPSTPPASTPAPAGRRWNPLALVVAVVLGGICALISESSLRLRPSPQPVAQTVQAEADVNEVLSVAADLTALRAHHLRLMHAVGDGDPEAERLIQFHEEHTRYARLNAQRSLEFPVANASVRDQELNTPDPLRYFVVEAGPEMRARHGIDTPGYMAFDHVHKVLYASPIGARFQLVLAGAGVLHEVSHAYDRLHGRETQWATAPQRMPGERRAYLLETRLVKRASMGRLDTLIRAMLRTRGPSVSCVVPLQISAAERESYRSLFSGIGSGEAIDYRMGIFALAVMVNFERNRQAQLGEAEELGCLEYLHVNPDM